MPMTLAWMDQMIIILREISQINKDKYMISLVCWIFFFKDKSELIYKTEQTSKTKLWLQRGKGRGRDKLRVWD